MIEYVAKFGTPEQKAALAGSLLTAKSKEAALETALEKQALINKGYMDTTNARIQGLMDSIALKGALGAFQKSGGENKDNKLAATILQGNANNLENEIAKLELAERDARPKDRPAIAARREKLQEQLDETRTLINKLLGDVKPSIAPKKDNKGGAATKVDNPEVLLGQAKDAVAKGANKAAVEARLMQYGYTKEQIDKDPYFKGWLR